MNLRHSNERFTFLKIPKICSIKTLLMCTIFSASINFILINLQIFHKGRGSAPYKGLGCPILPPDQWSDHKLFIITPTKQDWNQIADLTRLSQTLRLVGNVHWIVVEDDFNKSISVQHILQRSCHSYTHITHPVTNETGDIYRKTMGMLQRNAGLEALRKRYVLKSHDVVMDSINNKEYPSKEVGTVFFAYQDCTYDSKLFVFMRHVTTVGVWAVGLVGGTPVEHPVVRNDTVVGWNVKDRKQSLWPGIAIFLSFVLPTVIPHYFWGDTLTIAFFHALMRHAMLLNLVFFINSVAHMYGNRPYDETIEPRDNQPLSFFCFGEGWHNFHHAFPSDYRSSELPVYHFNLTTIIIDALAWLGQVHSMKVTAPSIVAGKKKRVGDRSH